MLHGDEIGNGRRLSLRDSERSLNGPRRTINDEQERPDRPFRFALPLLPVPQRVDAESETSGELPAVPSQLRPNRLHVDVLGHVNAVALLRATPLRIWETVYRKLKLSASGATVVVNSKALCHVLPRLVPRRCQPSNGRRRNHYNSSPMPSPPEPASVPTSSRRRLPAPAA